MLFANTRSGYLPLTIQWGSNGKLWSNPLITAGIGSVIAGAKLVGAWGRAA